MSRIRLENVAHDNNNMSLKEQKRKTNKQTNTVMKQTEEYIQMSSNWCDPKTF